MIKFINHNNEAPFKKFKGLYDLALKNNQSLIEAVLIASYDIENKEVDARYVNLKFIDNNKFIFLAIMSHLNQNSLVLIIRYLQYFIGNQSIPR